MRIGSAIANEKETFAIKDGDNVFGILPPMGELADNSYGWAQYYRIVWGDKGSNGKKRPYQDCRVVNSKKMVEVESAAYLRRQKFIEQRDRIKEQIKEIKAKDPNANIAELAKQYKTFDDLQFQYNIDSKFYINAITLDGKIGLLKIGIDAMKQIRALKKEYEQKGQSFIGLKGLFLNINRSGQGFGTKYKVTPYLENIQATVNGQEIMAKQEKYYELTDNIINRLEKEAWNLKDMYPKPTPEEVTRIVNEGAAAVDEILNKTTRTSPQTSTTTTNVTPTPTVITQAPTTPVQKTETPVQTPITQTVVSPPLPEQSVIEEDDVPFDIPSETIATQPEATPIVTTTVTTPTPTVTTPTPTVTPENLVDQSDEDFLKSIGAK